MPYTPQFGGTNNVPEIDLGQTGSPRLAAGTCHFGAHVIMGRVQRAIVVNELPKESVTFLEDLGTKSVMVTWDGQFRFKDAAAWEAVRSDLELYRSGQAIAAGVMGAYQAEFRVATKLTNGIGSVISATALLDDYQFRGRPKKMSKNPTFSYVMDLTVIFRIVA